MKDLDIISKERLHFKHTEYGFEWGPVRIERHIETKGAVVIGMDTKEGMFDIYITPTGKVKIIVPQGANIQVVGGQRKKRKK